MPPGPLRFLFYFSTLGIASYSVGQAKASAAPARAAFLGASESARQDLAASVFIKGRLQLLFFNCP